MSNTFYSERYDYSCEDGRGRKRRPKTFKNKEAAQKYAELHKIKNYELKNLRFNEEKPKYRIIVK